MAKEKGDFDFTQLSSEEENERFLDNFEEEVEEGDNWQVTYWVHNNNPPDEFNINIICQFMPTEAVLKTRLLKKKMYNEDTVEMVELYGIPFIIQKDLL